MDSNCLRKGIRDKQENDLQLPRRQFKAIRRDYREDGKSAKGKHKTNKETNKIKGESKNGI